MQTLTPAPTGLHGTLAVPGDKSISHRALMLGAISEGDTTIHHFLTAKTASVPWEPCKPSG